MNTITLTFKEHGRTWRSVMTVKNVTIRSRAPKSVLCDANADIDADVVMLPGSLAFTPWDDTIVPTKAKDHKEQALLDLRAGPWQHLAMLADSYYEEGDEFNGKAFAYLASERKEPRRNPGDRYAWYVENHQVFPAFNQLPLKAWKHPALKALVKEAPHEFRSIDRAYIAAAVALSEYFRGGGK